MIQRNKKWIFRILGLLLVFLLILGGYVLRVKSIQNSGITIEPSQDYPVQEVVYLLQTDPEWEKEPIGNTSRTMGSAGCLLTSVSVVMNHLSVAISPAELNDQLTAVNGFKGADLIWYKLHEAVPEIDYDYQRIFSRRTIEKDLANGRLPIVKVKYNGKGIFHWVVIIGAKDGAFYIFDPLNYEREPMALSVHGKVYAYRVLHLSEQ